MDSSRGFIRIYLDVETYRPEKKLDFTGEDIILVGLLHEEKEEPVFFENFERDKEKEMLEDLYAYLRELDIKHVEIIGFNILRYDIPLIISKTLKHGIVKEVLEPAEQGHEAELISKFWHDMYIIDLQQVLLPLNNMFFKGLRLDNIPQKLPKCEIRSQRIRDGKEIKKWYEMRKYDKIKKKNKEDLMIMRDIYRCITENNKMSTLGNHSGN
ncbi:MAG: ribonuclease H-like domain-containing protein [Sulfolobales archaeon]